ncbi:LamG-like jellyroll fold domain-containing protein [Lacipirellula limnantheis]|uniref:PEP-CTERM protein-sorting domain-containing protein n=1 Tax=Lacipirellula limnantheis TaxID=2528024 RepID=A0A517U0C1_9BACT|nr:PEP-CTERM sorting domain-containing protein [Lacipirellula limnantheis]QDT74070.1 hypothetical protein I41_32640 [Lacipirellula limnantheis]
MSCRKVAAFFVAGVGLLAATPQITLGDAYSNAVQALNPTHYYRLDETVVGTVTDIGAFPVNGTHEGDGVPASDPEVQLGEGVGQVGVPGPDNVYKYDPVTDILTTIPLPGFSPTNRAIFNNDSLAVNLGAPLGANRFASTTMTLATWFKFPNADMTQPGRVETVFGPGNGGGDRLFTNNFNGQDSPGTSALDTSDVDDLGHFQIDIGGANLIVSIDNNFSDPLKSNYQIVHRDGNDPGVGLAVKDGSWHHIVVSRNGDDIFNTILVVDGELITTDRYKDSTDSWGITAPFDARIGTRTTAPHHHTWGGWIDETALWIGRQLTAQEAIGLWNAATGQGPAGDFNADGNVDGADFLKWQQGGSPSPLSPADLATWKANFGASAVPAGAAVPEPAALALSLVALTALAARRRR